MKRNSVSPVETALLLALCALLLSGVWAEGRQRALSEKMIRLHVIAASDAPEDQAAKLRVRDGALALLEPALASAADAVEAESSLRGLLPALEETASAITGGRVRATLSREWYPTRDYGGFALPAGEYLSLRLALGEAAGRNWWCVVYPPLCAGAETLTETAALSGEDVELITENGPRWEIRFRLLEWWGELFRRTEEKEEEKTEAPSGDVPERASVSEGIT